MRKLKKKNKRKSTDYLQRKIIRLIAILSAAIKAKRQFINIHEMMKKCESRIPYPIEFLQER